MSGNITFNVDTKRVLQILTKEIYDSPYAMLRENVQNAYDAIRERFASNGTLTTGGSIHITIDKSRILVKDNGIGMSKSVLQNHFWKTGSSGKHSERARNAGVVGTFGIGAMANFGVCSTLTVETRSMDSKETFRTSASLDTLEIGKDCITLEELDEDRDFGTTVCAELQSTQALTEEQAAKYLAPYVNYLPIPVFLNGKSISQKQLQSQFDGSAGYDVHLGGMHKTSGHYSGFFDVRSTKNGAVSVICSELVASGSPIQGEIYLKQNGGQLMGLRSYFGLAPSPVIGAYRLGGVANLSSLHPTAGREALSRESIAEINAFIQIAESAASEAISKHRLADDNTSFIQWIDTNRRYDLSDNVTIKMFPEDKDIRLINIKENSSYKNKHYYTGSSKEIIETFSSDDSMLLIPSNAQHKRNIQIAFLTKFGIKPVPDEARILKIYTSSEVDFGDMRSVYRILSILRDDYLITDCDIKIADISHGVVVLPRKEGNTLHIFINHKSAFLAPARQFYEKAPELWSDYMIDFVRTYLYSKIQQFVPSATKMGIEALKRQLEKSRELYAYKKSESGFIDDLLGDELEKRIAGLFDGTLTLSQVISTTKAKATPQVQSVSRSNVGEIENLMQGLEEIAANMPKPEQEDVSTQNCQNQQEDFLPLPPIDRRNLSTDKKILTAKKEYSNLNNFTLFLGLSDKLMATEADFFFAPHTTRVIWSAHRVVFIFSESTSRINLYYDIELKNKLPEQIGFGGTFKTTTIITKDRIFIPIPSQLIKEFEVGEEAKEFFVRHDILYSQSENNSDSNDGES